MIIPPYLQPYELIALAIDKWAKQAKIEDGYEIQGPDYIDFDSAYCENCAETALEKAKGSLAEGDELYMCYVSRDKDYVDSCSICGVMLTPFLSEEGAIGELDHYKENGLQSPEDAYIFVDILTWGLIDYYPEQKIVAELILQCYQEKQLAALPDEKALREEEASIPVRKRRLRKPSARRSKALPS